MSGKECELTLEAVYVGSEERKDGVPGYRHEVDEWRVKLTVTENWGTIPEGQRIGALLTPRSMSVSFYQGDGHRKYQHGNRPPAGGVKLRRAEWHDTVPGKLTTFGKSEEFRGLASPPYLFAVPPRIGDVVECLVSDVMSLDEYRDEAEWLASGLNGELKTAADVRKATQTYHTVRQQDDELRRVLGDFYDFITRSGPEEGWSSCKTPTIILEAS